MHLIFPPIYLEDPEHPTWERALIRLAIAFEISAEAQINTIYVLADEAMNVYMNPISYIAHCGDDSPQGAVAAAEFFSRHAKPIRSWNEALTTAYPWFHNGEEMPK